MSIMTETEKNTFLATCKHAFSFPLKDVTYREMRVEWMKGYNNEQGTLPGYDCKICKNKGYVAVWNDNYDDLAIGVCKCMKIRKAAELLKASGNEKQLSKHRFDNFTDEIPIHKEMKTKAIAFCDFIEKSGGGKGFFVGGSVGSGKSHICCAICNTLINQMKAVIYMNWVDETRRVKANYSTSIETLERFRTADFLYIDDFLRGEPNPIELNIAYEIIDYRYRNELSTIISSEKTLRDLYIKDEAIASRLYEMCEGFIIKIVNARNMRIK